MKKSYCQLKFKLPLFPPHPCPYSVAPTVRLVLQVGKFGDNKKWDLIKKKLRRNMKISKRNSKRSEVNFWIKNATQIMPCVCSKVISDFDFLFGLVYLIIYIHCFDEQIESPPHHIIWFSCTATVLQLQRESPICTNITVGMVSSYVNSMLSWKKVMVYTRSLEIWRIHIKPTQPFRTCNATTSSGGKVWEILNALD